MGASVSSAGTIKDFVNKLEDGEVATLQQIHEAVTAAGIVKSLESVYADVQSLASRKQIGRADTARTYCRLQDQSEGRENRKVHADDTVAARKRTIKANGGRNYSSQEVLQGIAAELGPPRERSKELNSYAVVLLGDWDARYVLERAETVIGGRPSWHAVGKVGPNPAVYFYL